MRRAVVLLNPWSRGGARPPVLQMLEAFKSHGWKAEMWAGTGLEWTAEAVERAIGLGASAIFGAGGDGLLSAMLPKLLGTEVALGVVPIGTGNVWARELGLPLNPVGAIAAQLTSEPRAVDVGLANGRPFLVIAGVGVDAQIVQLVEAGVKPLGQFAYPLAGVSLAGSIRGEPCRVTVDDDEPLEVDLLACLLMNGSHYGGLVSVNPSARVDDGLLDMAMFTGSGTVDAAAHTLRVLAGAHFSDPNVLISQVKRVRIETVGSAALPFETDGEPRGTTPLEVNVQAGTLLALGLRP